MDTDIKKSTRYEDFKLLENNREVNKKHIERLKAAFNEYGNLTQVQPILVNDRMEIIDGQHRFTVCQELGLPVYFNSVTGLGVENARQMNILHRGWTAEDYARSYALGGDPNYQRYLELQEEFGFTFSTTLHALSNNDGKGAFSRFRAGELVIDELTYEIARDRLSKLDETRELTPIANNRTFARALFHALSVPGFDFKQLLKKLRYFGVNLKNYTSMADNMRQLEELYNWKQAEENRLRLY